MEIRFWTLWEEKKKTWARKCTRKERKDPGRKIITCDPFRRGIFIEEAVS